MRPDIGEILIFGGTTEGRTAAERLLAAGVPCTVSVATHYGEEVLDSHPLMTVHTGRLDRSRMAEMMREGLFSCVIDATHPYAQIVSREIEAACGETGLPYLRLQREKMDAELENAEMKGATQGENAEMKGAAQGENADMKGATQGDDTCVYVRDIDEAGAYLASVSGRILVTTGSKELVRFAKTLGDPARITARVLPAQESLRACAEAGLVGKQIFAMQGPFDLEMNCAQIHHTGASWLLTKETGAAGGYPEKIAAVRKCGIRAVVIRTPAVAGNTEGAGSFGTEESENRDSTGRTGSFGTEESENRDSTGRTGSFGTEESENRDSTGKSDLKEGPPEEAVSGCAISWEDESAADSSVSLSADSSVSLSADSSVNLSADSSVSLSADSSVSLAEDSSKGSAGKQSKQVSRLLNMEQAIAAALQYAACSGGREKRRLYLIGIGVGAAEALTIEAQEAIASAGVLFGAKSVLDNLRSTWKKTSGKTFVPIYDSAGILQYLAEHPQVHSAAVAYSGDSGFYSGAASMLAKLKTEGSDGIQSEPGISAGSGTAKNISSRQGESEPGISAGRGTAKNISSRQGESEPGISAGRGPESGRKYDYDVHVICGISSVSWFASRAGIPWQNWKILSSHGRFCNVTGHVRRNRECFLLLSGAEDLRRTGAMLAEAQENGMIGELRLIFGYELSRPAEEIRESTPRELTEVTKEGLYVLYIRHDDADRTAVVPGLPDTSFIRGKAPMTSSEIRALSLCRLGLSAGAAIWDVGAGTGSVSIEAALTCPEGRVWSVEFKKDALALLKENRAKFCLRNMEIVEGRAPEALHELPAPTHVFIGGSGGEVGEILNIIFSKNPAAKIVVNCITSETLAALQTALKDLDVCDLQCTQVIVNREEMLGRYHYLKAGNPVFIISFTGSGR